MLWLALTDMLSVLIVGKRGKVRNPAFLTRTHLIVNFAICLPLSSVHRFQHHLTSSRRKNGRQNICDLLKTVQQLGYTHVESIMFENVLHTFRRLLVYSAVTLIFSAIVPSHCHKPSFGNHI